MVKVGIIGNGGIAKAHRGAYESLKKDGVEVEIAAVADVRPECTANCEGERAYGDYMELLEAEQGKLDYVDICLPTFLHAPAAIKAMELGYNVLCEKPMAIDYESAAAMCETAKATGKLLMIALPCRFNHIFSTMKEWVDSEKLGKPITACFKRDGGTPMWSWENWFLKKELSGGAILDLHMHDVDAMQNIFGMPKAVTAAAANCIPGSGYDISSTIYHYDSDLYTTSTTNWATPHQKYGNDGRSIIFENGYIYSGTFEGKYTFVAVDKDGNVTDLHKSDITNGYYREIEYYIDCLVNGKPVDRCLPESAADSVRIIMAECESASKNGARIEL